MASATYTSVVTKSTIPSLYAFYKDRLSKEFLPHDSLTTLWFNYKNHFRTEQIVALSQHRPISIQWLLEPAPEKDLTSAIAVEAAKPLNSLYDSPVEYHKAITDAVIAYLKVQTGYSGARARSNADAERICDLVYSGLKAFSQRIFNDDSSSNDSGSSSSPSSKRNSFSVDSLSAKHAPHVFEYFSYLPIVAAIHCIGDIASSSPFWWYANQVATLVLVTDAITEYNSQERTAPYGAVFQAMTADLLYDLRRFENVFQTVTSFSLTAVQGLPSVIDAGFWEYDSDLEHPIDQISGSEQNAALCLFRKMFLRCNDPFTLTVLACPQTVETSRRLYRYLRECNRVTSQLQANATIVCSCETSICFRPKLDKVTMDVCYSITPDGLPCYRRREVIAVCLIWFVSVLATFFGLAGNPEVVEKYNVDPAGTASLVILFMGLVVSGYKMLRTDLWSWFDFVRGRYISKEFHDCRVPVEHATIVRLLNDDRRHFAPLVLRTKNSFLLGDRQGSFKFDIDISMEDMRNAGMMNYTDGNHYYLFDPFRGGRDGLALYRVLQISAGVYHVDDEAVQKVKPIRIAMITGKIV
ncbi:hypothetical protein BGZ67_007512 [Mortierella alpina]|nr:hypothetical protein BGZ67_007512 [Mortierella alpina]